MTADAIDISAILARNQTFLLTPVSQNGAAPDEDSTGDQLAEIRARYQPVDWKQAWLRQPVETDWLFHGIIERGTVNAIFATPGTGKSLFVLELAVRAVGDGHTVVYIDEENRIEDLVDRLQAFGCNPDDLDRLRCYSFPSLPALDTPQGGLHLRAIAEDADLVVLDTTTRMVAGKENDADTFLQLYRCSLAPLKKDGKTIIRLDHPGKDLERGQRGSSAKDGDVDTVWQMSTVIDGIEYRLDRLKTRQKNSGLPSLTLTRRYEPLRHEWAGSEFSMDQLSVRVLEILDVENIPIKTGRDTVRRVLSGHGIRISNEQVSAIIRQRKAVPDRSWTGADSQKTNLSAAVPHVSADSGQDRFSDLTGTD